MKIKKNDTDSSDTGNTDKSAVDLDEVVDCAQRILKGKAGVSGWDIYLEEEKRFAVEVREGQVESLISARTLGLAIRVLSKGRMGLSYTNDFFPESIAETVGRALEAARYMSEDSSFGFAGPPLSGGYPSIRIFDSSLEGIPEQDKVALAMRIEASALSFDPRVKRVRGSEYEEYISGLILVNSEGVESRAKSTLVMGSLEAVAEDKSGAQAASEFESAHHYDKLNVEDIGKGAAKKAVDLLGGRPLSGGQYPVVLSPEAASGMISVLAPSVFGDSVVKHRSWLADKLGKKIASPAVTIVDDGLWEEGPAAFSFDDEGTASGRTTVVGEGVLENFLYDIYYGNKAGRGSTGNGLRPSYSLPPAVDTTNWMLLPGSLTDEELVAQADDGLLIVELLGLHTADSVTGEFSLGACGFRIRGGKVAEPVVGIAMAGTLAELLEKVEAVGNKVKFFGSTGSPAVLIGEMDISGPE